jgi:DNA-binding transcriptional LysR family regulator
VQLSQVEAVVAVARDGQISRAATSLFVTQPALTARIHSLEDELGTTLFTRSGRGMELTAAGRAFLPYAERALAALNDGSALLAELGRGGAGELRVGAAPAVSTYVLPLLLVRYTEAHPNVRLVVRTGHSEEIVELVLRQEIDVGLTRELAPDRRIASRTLYEDELVLVARRGHPLTLDDRVDVSRIGEARLILFDRTSSYFDLTNAFFRQAGVAPRGVMELDNIDAAKQMVEQGLGIALLPTTSIAAELADGRLAAISLRDAAPLRRRIVAIRPAVGTAPSPPLAAFLAILDRIDELVPRPAA